MTTMNKALKLLREFHNMRQSELARRLGIAPSYMSEIEAGSNRLRVDLLYGYAFVFDMPIATIAELADRLDGVVRTPLEEHKAKGRVEQILRWKTQNEEFVMAQVTAKMKRAQTIRDAAIKAGEQQ